MRYASAIHCYENQGQLEEACVRIRSALVLPLNAILNEFQARQPEEELEIQSYLALSNAFRNQLREWLAKHDSPTSILNALHGHPEELAELDRTYGALIDLPKSIHAPEINAMAARQNIHRYIDELKPVDPIFKEYLAKNEVILTPEIVGILAKIRQQLSNYYKSNN
jgi:hypothetical protein